MQRASGVLLHISSLPSEYGIGTFGKEAYKFIDFLKRAGQTYWQILPIGPTSFGDSPYSSFSTFAGNPYFIDFDLLRKEKLLKKKDYADITWFEKDNEVNYGILYENRYKVLRKAVKNFIENEDYQSFVDNNPWLDSYALFMSIKNTFNGVSWLNWPEEYRLIENLNKESYIEGNAEEIRFWKVIQYLFFKQFSDLKEYAKENGIKIFGDCPIYVALDSCDVWANRDLFKFDKNGFPCEVAGVPPDYFSNTGQLWGNPIYNWSKHKANNYKWWIDRLKHLAKFYDAIRIDHFIAFDTYYSVNYGSENAIDGKHHKGPGMKLINAINEQIDNVQIIAEDLGALTSSMRKLLKESGYPGMKVLRFGFDGQKDNEHLPHTYKNNLVAYVTSHDTETCMGWINHTDFIERNYINNYLKNTDYNNFNWIAIESVMNSNADLCIAQAQDLLGLADDARMNKPAIADGNWKWRLTKGQLDAKIAHKLKRITEKAKRI